MPRRNASSAGATIAIAASQPGNHASGNVARTDENTSAGTTRTAVATTPMARTRGSIRVVVPIVITAPASSTPNITPGHGLTPAPGGPVSATRTVTAPAKNASSSGGPATSRRRTGSIGNDVTAEVRSEEHTSELQSR